MMQRQRLFIVPLIIAGLITSSQAFVSPASSISIIQSTHQVVGGKIQTSLYEQDGKKASVQLSTPSLPTKFTPTSVLDYILSLLTSDLSSIILGSIGILLALSNRLSSIDYEATLIQSNQAADMGMQSRMDLLAVFSAGAVLLNGVSKLDITSVVAETVDLNGVMLDNVMYNPDYSNSQEIDWTLESVQKATPAKCSAVVIYDDDTWKIVAMKGIVAGNYNKFWNGVNVSTPILDRFLKNEVEGKKETYLPTLQALPGKAEFVYLPQNTQGVLMVPMNLKVDGQKKNAALVLGSDTAKSFTPRDVAWCQVLASRLANTWSP